MCGQPDTNTAVNTQPARPAPVATRVVCVQDADCRLQDCSFSGKEQASKSTNCRLQSAGFQFQISATRQKLRAAADCRVRPEGCIFKSTAFLRKLKPAADCRGWPEGCRFQSTAFLRKSETCRRLQSLAGRVQISEYSFFAEICNLPQTAQGADFRLQLSETVGRILAICLKQITSFSECKYSANRLRVPPCTFTSREFGRKHYHSR